MSTVGANESTVSSLLSTNIGVASSSNGYASTVGENESAVRSLLSTNIGVASSSDGIGVASGSNRQRSTMPLEMSPPFGCPIFALRASRCHVS